MATELKEVVIAAKSRAGTGVMINGSWYNGSADMLKDINKDDTVNLTHGDNRQLTAIAVTKKAAVGTGGADGRQNTITFQSARNAAIELHSTLMAAGILSSPAKKDAKYDAAMAFINEHTAIFYTQATAVYEGKSIEEAFV